MSDWLKVMLEEVERKKQEADLPNMVAIEAPAVSKRKPKKPKSRKKA